MKGSGRTLHLDMANSELTMLLQQFGEGKADSNALLDHVYAELKQMANARIARESEVITMGATGLVHEAWLRLGGEDLPEFENRRHFFAAAAEVMRRILIERARAAKRDKRGAGATRITLQDGHHSDPGLDVDLLGLDLALRDLEALDQEMAQIVKLRYFCGLTVAETAELLSLSPRTINRTWTAARAWMKVRLA